MAGKPAKLGGIVIASFKYISTGLEVSNAVWIVNGLTGVVGVTKASIYCVRVYELEEGW